MKSNQPNQPCSQCEEYMEVSGGAQDTMDFSWSLIVMCFCRLAEVLLHAHAFQYIRDQGVVVYIHKQDIMVFRIYAVIFFCEIEQIGLESVSDQYQRSYRASPGLSLRR